MQVIRPLSHQIQYFFRKWEYLIFVLRTCQKGKVVLIYHICQIEAFPVQLKKCLSQQIHKAFRTVLCRLNHNGCQIFAVQRDLQALHLASHHSSLKIQIAAQQALNNAHPANMPGSVQLFFYIVLFRHQLPYIIV